MYDEAAEKKDLMRVRSRIINELIHKIAQLLENTIAVGLPLSQMGGVLRASISAAYDTLKEEIAESEAAEEASLEEAKSRSSISPQFADEEARSQLADYTTKQFNERLKPLRTMKETQTEITHRRNRIAKQSKRLTSSGIKRLKRIKKVGV